MGLNFGIGLFIAAMSGTALFGTISLMIVNASVFSILTGFGTESAILWHGASKKFTGEKLFTYAFFSSLIQTGLFILISLLFFRITNKTLLSNQHQSSYFYFELIYFLGITVVDKYIAMLYAEQKAAPCNRVLAIAAFCCLLFIALAYSHVFYFSIDPLQLFCVVTFFQLLVLAVFFHVKNNVKIIKGFFIQDIRSFAGFSFVVYVTNLIQFLAYRADYWFIDYFKNTDKVGIYAQANKFAQLLWVIPGVLAALLAPFVADPEKKMIEKEFVIITKLMNYLNLAIAALIILVAFLFYNYFLPVAFSDGFQSLLIMMPGFYFFTMTTILAAYFSGKRLLWINFVGSALCFLVIVISDLILIPKLGINGAAVANSIAYTASAIFCVILFIKITHSRFFDFIVLRKNDLESIKKL